MFDTLTYSYQWIKRIKGWENSRQPIILMKILVSDKMKRL